MNTRMTTTGFRKYAFCAALFALGLLVGSGPAVAAVTLSAGSVNGQAGQVAAVPITLDAGSAQILNIQFNLTVVAQGGAPAITATMTYQANTPPGAPGLTDSSTPGQFLVGYPSDISPPLTGTVVMGTLGVPIPQGATGSYQVQVLNPSALDPDGNDVSVTGQPGTVALAPSGPTLSAGSVNGQAGQVASVPITLDAGSAQILNIQFNLTVAAQGGAPAITGTLTYQANTPPGAPGLTDSSTPGQFLVGYPSDISPPLTGTVAMGTLGVPIPDGASGATYQVQVLNPSALDPDGNDVTVTGQAGTITLAGTPAPTTPPVSTPTNTPVTPSTPTNTPVTPSTSTPTKTAVVTATVTATKPPATATPTASFTPGTPSVCPACPEDDDGCQIGARGHTAAWLLLIPAIGLLVVRRRRG